MAVWECGECTTKYSVGAPQCPQCGSVVRVNEKTQPPEEDKMAKITVHGGPSVAGEEPEAAVEPEAVEESAAEESSAPEPAPAPRQRKPRSK